MRSAHALGKRDLILLKRGRGQAHGRVRLVFFVGLVEGDMKVRAPQVMYTF